MNRAVQPRPVAGSRHGHLDPPTEPIVVPRAVGPSAPTGPQSPDRRLIVVGCVVALCLAVAGLGWALAGGGTYRPCSSPLGSELAGFDDVVGPVAVPLDASYRDGAGEACRYATADLASSGAGTTGSSVLVLRASRTVVDADPEKAALFTRPVWSTIPESSDDYPIDLVRSGVAARVSPGDSGDSAAVTATCRTDDDYWSVLVGAQGYDASVGLDELLTTIGCEPIRAS